jgi:AcrR family transcriptional regulator
MAKRTNIKPSPTRERIITVASQHFFMHGHRGITMDRLAAKIGVSKKTVYTYFPTKLAILEAVMDRRFEQLEADLQAVRQAHAENSVECLQEVLLEWQRQLSEAQPVFWHDLQLDSACFLESTAARRHRIIHGVFGTIIEEGIQHGVFRPDLSPHFMAELVLATAEGIIRLGKWADLSATPKDFMVTMVSLMIEGSLTNAGREQWQQRKEASDTTP